MGRVTSGEQSRERVRDHPPAVTSRGNTNGKRVRELSPKLDDTARVGGEMSKECACGSIGCRPQLRRVDVKARIGDGALEKLIRISSALQHGKRRGEAGACDECGLATELRGGERRVRRQTLSRVAQQQQQLLLLQQQQPTVPSHVVDWRRCADSNGGGKRPPRLLVCDLAGVSRGSLSNDGASLCALGPRVGGVL